MGHMSSENPTSDEGLMQSPLMEGSVRPLSSFPVLDQGKICYQLLHMLKRLLAADQPGLCIYTCSVFFKAAYPLAAETVTIFFSAIASMIPTRGESGSAVDRPRCGLSLSLTFKPPRRQIQSSRSWSRCWFVLSSSSSLVMDKHVHASFLGL